jgi:hypothetical protein
MSIRIIFIIYFILQFVNIPLVNIDSFSILPIDILNFVIIIYLLAKKSLLIRINNIFKFLLLILILGLTSTLFLRSYEIQIIYAIKNVYLVCFRIFPFVLLSQITFINRNVLQETLEKTYYIFTYLNIFLFIIYIYFLININVILNNPNLWHVTYFPFELGQGGILRYQMFFGDSNFYVWAVVILSYLQFLFESKVNYLFIFLNIGISLFSFSRTGMVLIILFFLYIIFFEFSKRKKYILLISFLLILFIIFFFIPETNSNIIFENYVSIFATENIEKSPRFEIWSNFLNNYNNSSIINILFGFGPRISLVTDNYYLHNTYFEIAQEFGLVGILLFLIFLISLSRRIKNSENKINIIFIIFSNLIFMITFSITYNPFLWFQFWVILNENKLKKE